MFARDKQRHAECCINLITLSFSFHVNSYSISYRISSTEWLNLLPKIMAQRARCSFIDTDIQSVGVSLQTLRVHSHSYEYESGYLYTGSSKHEFACI